MRQYRRQAFFADILSRRKKFIQQPVLKAFRVIGDVAIICLPSHVPDTAQEILSAGISTVDCCLHTNILNLRSKLDAIAKQNNCTAITAAGAPRHRLGNTGIVFGNAPKGYHQLRAGMAWNSVAAKSIPGVKDALSMTIRPARRSQADGLYRA